MEDKMKIVNIMWILLFIIVIGFLALELMKVECLEDVAEELCNGEVLEHNFNNYNCLDEKYRMAKKYYFTENDKLKCN